MSSRRAEVEAEGVWPRRQCDSEARCQAVGSEEGRSRGTSAEAGMQLGKARQGLPRASEGVWRSQQLDLSPVKLVLDF